MMGTVIAPRPVLDCTTPENTEISRSHFSLEKLLLEIIAKRASK